MSKRCLYVQELHAINAAHRGGEKRDFRTQEVFCVDKFGRKVNFSKPHDVVREMDRVINAFAAEFEKVSDIPELALTFARFFYAFIAIHPFEDANRRTAFTFLENRAREKSFEIGSMDLLRRVLLEGAVAEEMQKLRSLFIIMLKPQAKGA